MPFGAMLLNHGLVRQALPRLCRARLQDCNTIGPYVETLRESRGVRARWGRFLSRCESDTAAVRSCGAKWETRTRVQG
jgi:hypothetical protein